MFKQNLPFVAACVFTAVTPAFAQDVFVRVQVSQLEFKGGPLAPEDETANTWRMMDVLIPSVTLSGPGEAYIGDVSDEEQVWSPTVFARERSFVVAKIPAGATLAGTLLVPDPTWTRLEALKFTAPQTSGDAERVFYRAKAAHYERLQRLLAPGSAFFRREADLARKAGGQEQDAAPQGRRANPAGGLEGTYELFTGGRAVSENLQLSRELIPPGARAPEPDETLVATSSIQGITVAAFDWTSRLADRTPALDPLASSIPLDQHVVFFPTFEAFQTALDTVAGDGLPIYSAMSGASEDRELLQRYERQLCLPRTDLARAIGGGLVQSVALTGGDPYFSTGTDLAVVFQSTDTQALRTALALNLAAARAIPGVQASKGEAGGIAYEGVSSSDRSICSYIGASGDTVVVTNSLAQFKSLGAVAGGSAPSIASLKEYQYFRDRYPQGAQGETAFAFISDPTIRRWCGPVSRIAASRRIRALAVMADTTAAHMNELAAGLASPAAVVPEVPMRTIGDVTLTPTGVRSSVYGGLAFVTPISELDVTSVTSDEAASYKRWRDSYQRNWSWAFDPIAVSMGVAEGRVSADMSVIPLIAATRYRTWSSVFEGASITANAGDPHDAILHAVFAVNTRSAGAQEASGFARMFAPAVEIDPLGWMGQSLAIYADPDPLWERLIHTHKRDELFETEGYNPPVAIHAEVSSALKLTAFLAAVRGWLEEVAPGMAAWETRTHHDQAYVSVGLSEKAKAESGGGGFDKTRLFYAATAKALIITVNEDLLKRAIDRQASRAKGDAKESQAPWQGKSMALRFKEEGLALYRDFEGTDKAQELAQRLAWANLHILNEWKRRYPERDPLDVHQAFWGERLTSPGGGSYAWDPSLGSMISVDFGHPAAPKAGPATVDPLGLIRAGDLGVTLQDQGLRARAVLEKKTSQDHADAKPK